MFPLLQNCLMWMIPGISGGQISGFLFVNTSGNVWNEPGFRELIKRIVERHNKDAEENHTEKIENFCPHMARHT